MCPTGIDIRDGSQLACIQCGLCIDACDNVMKKIGREPRLIGYDNDINIHRRMEGKPEVFRTIRARTVTYTALIAVVGAIMLYTLSHRTLLDVNVLHDRNPLAVRLSDGSVRNGYTMRVLNKQGVDRVVSVEVEGPASATLQVIGAETTAGERPTIPIGPDQTLELRVLVTVGSEDNLDKSTPVRFRVIDTKSGEVAAATDNFVTP